MQKLTSDYVFRAPGDTIGKIEIGYLDLAFTGTDLEWYKSFFDDRFGLGLQYQYVYKRPVENMFGIYNDLKYDAKFCSTIFVYQSYRFKKASAASRLSIDLWH